MNALIVLIFLVLGSYWEQPREVPCPTAVLSVEQLQQVYAQANEAYFNDSLPKDVPVDYGEYDDHFMASTQPLPGGRFHIALNESYSRGARYARLSLLHEQCHVKTWGKEKEPHGPVWRTCMLQLDMQGAFREQLIDGYKER